MDKKSKMPMNEALARFESALGASHLSYDTIIAAFRALEIPGNVTLQQTDRLLEICYRILDCEGIANPASLADHMEGRLAGHLMACAEGKVEELLYDRNARTRKWIIESIQGFQRRGQSLPEGLSEDDIPPAIDIPWERTQAAERIAPYLRYCEQFLQTNPTAHVALAWNVLKDGYPAISAIFEDWLTELDRLGLGAPRTLQAIAMARDLMARADAGETMSWTVCEAEVLPLLDHPHPLVAAHAARFLGAFYSEEGLSEDDSAWSDRASYPPPLPDMLERLRRKENNRYIICGGFIDGFDSDCAGLYTLARDKHITDAQFDIDAWVFGVLKEKPYEPFLPGAQSFWFYLHEYYDYRPDIIDRMIKAGRDWIAMMCATEVHDKVDGMEPVLRQLAGNDDPEIAASARWHLDRYY